MNEFKLCHAPQQNPWGCLWHAMYAVTGEAAFLRPEYLSEIHSFRIAIIAFGLGWMVMPIFTDNSLGHAARVSPGFWSQMQRLARTHDSSLLLVVGYQLTDGLGHAVGVAFQTDGMVSISDSLYLRVITLPVKAFLESTYATDACHIQQVLGTQLDAYPAWHAATMFRDAIRRSHKDTHDD